MKNIFILLSIFTLLNCKIETNQETVINVVETEAHFYVGDYQKKTFGFNTDFQDDNNIFDPTDIEENTKFNIYFSNNTSSENSTMYTIFGRLWKDEQNKIYVFCAMEENIEKEVEYFKFIHHLSVIYKDLELSLKFNVEPLELMKKEGNVPFLYSTSQEKIITDQKKIELEFKYDSYDEQPLFLVYNEMTIFNLENCQIGESKILKCEITKENLDIFANKENSFKLSFFKNEIGFNYLPFVRPMNIIYPETKKEDIYFKIVKVVNNDIEDGSFVTFETNVTKLDKIKTLPFELNLPQNWQTNCVFIKHDKSSPLYLSCQYQDKTNRDLEEIEGFNKTDLHHKYNFILGTQQLGVSIKSTGTENSGIGYVYPDTLDFTKKDSFELAIDSNIKNVRLYKEGEDLECNGGELYKICNVTKSYFKNKKSGYYIFHHKINENLIVANYESFGVNVILPNSSVFRKYSFGLFVLICVLIL